MIHGEINIPPPLLRRSPAWKKRCRRPVLRRRTGHQKTGAWRPKAKLQGNFCHNRGPRV